MKTIKSALFMGAALLCKLVAGLIAVKFCAHFLGVENFGLTGQISSLMAIVTLLSSGGVSVGLTKIFADAQYEASSRPAWQRAAMLLAGASAIILFAVFILMRTTIESRVLGQSPFALLIFVGVCVSIIPISLSGIAQGIINGSQRDRAYGRSLILGSVMGIAGFLILSYGFDTPGALLGMIWMAVAQALAFIWTARRLRLGVPRPVAGAVAARDLRTRARFLFNFGMLSIAAGATIPLVYMAVRMLIETYQGAEVLGVWQATVRLSEAYTQLPVVMLSVVFFSRFAGTAGAPLNARRVQEAYGFVFGLMLFIAACVYLARYLLVQLLFTPQFSGVADFIGWQLLGDTLRMLAYTGTIILGARGKLRWGIAGEFAQALLFSGLSALLIPRYGAVGPFLAYVSAYFVYLIMTLVTLRYVGGWEKNHASVDR